MSKSLLLLIDGYNVIGPVAAPGRRSGSTVNFGGSKRSRHTEGASDWLQSERMSLLNRLAAGLPEAILSRTCVVFDAANPPPDRPTSFIHHGAQVRFAVGYPEADDLLEEIIAAHHSAKQLSVVSSDRRVQVAARRRGATSFESDAWLGDLLDRRPQLVHWPRGTRPAAKGHRSSNQGDSLTGLESLRGESSGEKPDGGLLNPDDVREWIDEFGLDQ